MSDTSGSTPIRIEAADPDNPVARELIEELGAELTRAVGWFAPASYAAEDARAPRSVFVMARDELTGRAVGCGAIRALGGADAREAELKRMYARAGTKGVGHAILKYLEDAARSFGYLELWLETGASNTRALRFYERHGYRPVPNFGPYVGHPESVCLGKSLVPLGQSPKL